MRLSIILNEKPKYSERSKDVRKRCVAHVMAQGKPEDVAWPICMRTLIDAGRIKYSKSDQKWLDLKK